MSSRRNPFKGIIVPPLEMADISCGEMLAIALNLCPEEMLTGQIEPCITGRYLVAFCRVTSLLRNIH